MDVDAVIARSLAPARREIERAKVYRSEVSDSELDCTSRDRTVTVTQTLGGRVVKVDIRPGAFEEHDEASLGRLLTDLLQSAQSAAKQSARQLTDQIIREREGRTHG